MTSSHPGVQARWAKETRLRRGARDTRLPFDKAQRQPECLVRVGAALGQDAPGERIGRLQKRLHQVLGLHDLAARVNKGLARDSVWLAWCW
jgi:hypothetical protein